MTTYGSAAVTGGSGFVGRHLVEALLNIGKRVIVVDLIEPEKKSDEFALEYRSADIRHSEAARRALSGAEVVFHLAGNPSGTVSVRDPWRGSAA
jgi:UDP-glucose 4-epimerase